MGRTIRLVLSIPSYALLAIISAVVGLSVFVLTRNYTLFFDVILFGGLPLDARLSVLVGLYPLVGNAYTPATGLLLLVTSALVGVNLAMVGYHLAEHDLSIKDGSTSFTGVVFGTLGAGCASCGSALLTGLLSAVGAGGALTLLPLDGLEFVFGALVVLILSIHWITTGLRGGRIRGCPVDVS